MNNVRFGNYMDAYLCVCVCVPVGVRQMEYGIMMANGKDSGIANRLPACVRH